MRHTALVTYKSVDHYYTAEYKGKYNINGYHVRFTCHDTNEVLVWNTVISPNKSNPVELHSDELVKITYENDMVDALGQQHIKNVRFVK